MQPTVLVIDDTVSSATVVRHALAPEFRVITALTGEDGLALAEQERPDVVLLDVMLPQMDGFAVCRAIRASKTLFGVPVVMISALEDRASRLAGFEAGADDFVSKPVDRLELSLRMRSIVQLNRFRKLLEAREQFEVVFLLSPDPQLLVDHDSYKVLLSNVAASELDLRGRWLHAVDPRDHAAFDAACKDLEHMRSTTVVARLSMLSGDQKTAECRLSATDWEGRRAVIISIRDISDRMKVEARKQQDARIQAALAATAGMAHDFGNYLMAIQGGVELALRALPSDHPTRAVLETADATADQAAQLVHRATALAKGVSSMLLQPVDLAAFVRGLEPAIRTMLGHINLTLALDEKVAEAIADPAYLERILMNLVANARAAIVDRGTVTITLQNAERTDGRAEVQLAVRDTGCGMTPEVQRRLFEPYFTTRADMGGTGLGLATVQRLMELQGGAVSVVSAVGVGTTMTLTLPAARAADTLIP